MSQKISVVALDSDTALEGRAILLTRLQPTGLAEEIGRSGDFAILSAAPN
jgi:hypothetical protein